MPGLNSFTCGVAATFFRRYYFTFFVVLKADDVTWKIFVPSINNGSLIPVHGYSRRSSQQFFIIRCCSPILIKNFNRSFLFVRIFGRFRRFSEFFNRRKRNARNRESVHETLTRLIRWWVVGSGERNEPPVFSITNVTIIIGARVVVRDCHGRRVHRAIMQFPADAANVGWGWSGRLQIRTKERTTRDY